jgi:hypothetical protein
MRDIDLTELLPDVLFHSNEKQNSRGDSIYLTIAPDLTPFPWNDNSLEILIFNLFTSTILAKKLDGPIRLAVAEKRRISDLETLLNIHPAYWIQLRIDVQSATKFDDMINRELENSGYNAEDEWVPEGLPARLTAYSQMNHKNPKLLFWIEHHKASHRYTILIPISPERS